MKTPRVTDFDPDAKVPSLKSSMDNMPSIQKPQPGNRINSQQNTPILAPHSEPRPILKRPTRQQPITQPTKRSYVRRTFDFYEDQITYLTRKSLQEKLAGKELSMNEIVREAIDDWISKNNYTK